VEVVVEGMVVVEVLVEGKVVVEVLVVAVVADVSNYPHLFW